MDDGRTPLTSGDVARLGNVQWWNLASQCNFHTSWREQCNARRRLEDAAWCLRGPSRKVWRRKLPHARWSEARNENRESVEDERWDRVLSATFIGCPWPLMPEQRKLVRLAVLVAEADQGVAPVIVMPAVPRVDRR